MVQKVLAGDCCDWLWLIVAPIPLVINAAVCPCWALQWNSDSVILLSRGLPMYLAKWQHSTCKRAFSDLHLNAAGNSLRFKNKLKM